VSGPGPIGGYVHPAGDIELNAGRPVTRIAVVNTGDRPIQVGSHYHFAETNRALRFDRLAAYGQRLDIPAGTAVRFEPGDTRDVELVPIEQARHLAKNLGGPCRLVEISSSQGHDTFLNAHHLIAPFVADALDRPNGIES